MAPRPEFLAHLPSAPASTIKREGWKGTMRALKGAGRLVVTNHGEPEAVILSVDEYFGLIQAAHSFAYDADDPLRVLRQRFDARLAILASPDAGDPLRDTLQAPAQLDGAVRAGESF